MQENINVVSNDDTQSNQAVAVSKYIYTGDDKFADVIQKFIGHQIAEDYAKEIADGDEVDTAIVRTEIRNAIEQTYYYHGQETVDRKGNKKKSPLYKIPDCIPPALIEAMAVKCGKFCALRTEDSKYVLAVHFTSGKHAHLWRQVNDIGGDAGTPSAELVETINWFHKWNANLKGKTLVDMMNNILSELPVRTVTRDDKYRVFNNGLWTYTSQHDGYLTKWEDVDESLTFNTKIPFDLHTEKILAEPILTEPDGTQWKFSEWLHTVFNSDDECDAWMEIITASFNPHHNWKSFVLLLDGTGAFTGNNSKSTLLDLIIDITGGTQSGQVTSVPVARFGDDFALESAINTSLIVSHENDETGVISGAALAMLKAIATDNEVSITRKFKSAITMKLHALVLAAFNQTPSWGHIGENFERRIRCFLFKNCFTGREKAYIAEDFLKRKEVIEYVIWYCIHKVGNITKLTDYDFYTDSLAFFKQSTEPVARFIEDILNEPNYIKNDYISKKMLYEYYKAWYSVEYGSTKRCISRPTFWDVWEVNLKFLKGWQYTEDVKTITSGAVLNAYEPFLDDYKCVEGMNWQHRKYTVDEYETFDEQRKQELCHPRLPGKQLHGCIFKQKSA